MCVVYLTCCIVLLCMLGYTFTIEVTITRSLTSEDVIAFRTRDYTVCEKFGANGIDESNGTTSSTVTCTCSKHNVFYSSNALERPSCQNGNANIFGCSNCHLDCVAKLTAFSGLQMGWIKSGVEYSCNNADGSYAIKYWDGKQWEDFERTNDMRLYFYTAYDSHNTISNTSFYFQWKENAGPHIIKYSAKLFLITAYCKNKKLQCFLASSAGTQRFTIENDMNPKKEETNTEKNQTTIWIGVVTGLVSFILILTVVIIILYRRRRATRKKSNHPSKPTISPVITHILDGTYEVPSEVVPATIHKEPEYTYVHFKGSRPSTNSTSQNHYNELSFKKPQSRPDPRYQATNAISVPEKTDMDSRQRGKLYHGRPSLQKLVGSQLDEITTYEIDYSDVNSPYVDMTIGQL